VVGCGWEPEGGGGRTGAGTDRRTDEGFLGVEGKGEVGDGDVPVQWDEVEGFPVEEDIPCGDVGELGGSTFAGGS
jgi:hypothetical protein